MLLCAAGDIHGAIDRMYEDILTFEATLGERFDWVLHVGDFGIWPDPNRIDRASRTHDGAGDFPAWLANGRAGIRFEKHRRSRDWVSEAAGLDLLISRLQPLVCFFGHHHTRVDGEVAGVRCIGLNKVQMPGNLVAIDIDPRRREWCVRGEWPARRSW